MIEQLLTELHKRYTTPNQTAKQTENYQSKPSVQPSIQPLGNSPDVKVDQATGRRYIPTLQALQMLESKRQFNIGVADDVSKRYGIPVSPRDSYDNVIAQVKGLKPLDVQKTEQDQRFTMWDYTGKDPVTGQQKYDPVAARPKEPDYGLEFDIWKMTGEAPPGIPGVDPGTPIYDKVGARQNGGVTLDDIRQEFLQSAKLYQQSGGSVDSFIREQIIPNAEQILSEGLDVNKVVDEAYNAFSKGQFPTRKAYFENIKKQMIASDPYGGEEKFNKWMQSQQLNFSEQKKGGEKLAYNNLWKTQKEAKSSRSFSTFNQLIDRAIKEAGVPAQWKPYLTELFGRESSWNHAAKNPKSTAHGYAQFLNSTRANYEKKYPQYDYSNPLHQLVLGIYYVKDRYKDPVNALKHWDQKKWY